MDSTLLTAFPDPIDLLAIEPEELAGIMMELIPKLSNGGDFTLSHFVDQVFSPIGQGGYDRRHKSTVVFAFAEGMEWLKSHGLMMQNPEQSGSWHMLTRRGRAFKVRSDLETFRLGRTLPVELLQPALAKKVESLFLRGDHDIAVLQAFKEVEVAVRRAAKLPDELVGVPLMRKAFHPDSGALTDGNLIFAEREAEMALFAGAIGHAKNPASHREVNMPRDRAARLIVFASHLLDIVDSRA